MAVKNQKKISHIKKKELDLGLNVILLPAHYIPTWKYPVWGSKYSCIGTIIEIQRDKKTLGGGKATLVRINWKSGAHGLYSYKTVALASNADTSDPNLGFKIFRKGMQ